MDNEKQHQHKIGGPKNATRRFFVGIIRILGGWPNLLRVFAPRGTLPLSGDDRG